MLVRGQKLTADMVLDNMPSHSVDPWLSSDWLLVAEEEEEDKDEEGPPPADSAGWHLTGRGSGHRAPVVGHTDSPYDWPNDHGPEPSPSVLLCG